MDYFLQLPGVVIISITLLLLRVPGVTAVNFNSCITDVRSGNWGLVGGMNNHGQPVDISAATAVSYDLCIRACGATAEPFVWSTFSQQFSSWLLPWLSLVSQLPFGANDKLDNLVSVLLAVGSPTLAAYSLALTVLDGRWIARRFLAYRYPNTKQAVQILSSLQQAPITVTTGSLLSSLVILPENDEWWSELVARLDYTHTWSVSAATSIAWVIIAYIFTLVDSFTGDPTLAINSNGQAVGSLWLWLLPIVVGWLQVSPKCDSMRVKQAIEKANKLAYIASDNPASDIPVLASSESELHAISLSQNTDDLRCDERCTAPIYNYARFLPWAAAVESVCKVFHAASEHAHKHRPVNPQVDWVTTEKSSRPSDKNRTGSRIQVDEYCLPVAEPLAIPPGRWIHGTWSRFTIASLLALFLQWGTTGAAVVNTWFTPTTGLGCRSGGFLLYAALSTISWMFLVTSSYLCYCSTTAPAGWPSRTKKQLSIALRRLGKIIASINAIWILVSCMFQFSNFYDRCYCNSSVWWWGLSRAFDVILLEPADITKMTGAWIGGTFLAVISALVYVVFVKLFIDPSLPDSI